MHIHHALIARQEKCIKIQGRKRGVTVINSCISSAISVEGIYVLRAYLKKLLLSWKKASIFYDSLLIKKSFIILDGDSWNEYQNKVY